jgi:hypothetical protein
MKIRLGIIGPIDSIENILETAKEFSELELITFPYNRTEETEQIILENRHHVDRWLFSGQAPYYFALAKGVIKEEEGSFTPLYGSSLFSALLEAQISEGKVLRKISLDTIRKEEIDTIKKSTSLKKMKMDIYPYSGYLPAEGIINFHKQLYNNGEIDVAITCIQLVYKRLRELGIPCYRVKPSPLAIRQELLFLKERSQSSWYRKAQLAILGVEVIQQSSGVSEENYYSYQMRHQELELQRSLLDYAKLINGSLVRMGDGLFFIYTTRGEIDFHLSDQSLF